MNDNTRRALRTFLQMLVGMVASGGLTTIWNDYLSRHDVDPTITIAVGLLLGCVVSWAQNQIEDSTGHGILLAKDRMLGDKMMDTGVGSKQA